MSDSNNSNQECSIELRNLFGFNGFIFNCIVAKKIAPTAIWVAENCKHKVVRKL